MRQIYFRLHIHSDKLQIAVPLLFFIFLTTGEAVTQTFQISIAARVSMLPIPTGKPGGQPVLVEQGFQLVGERSLGHIPVPQSE